MGLFKTENHNHNHTHVSKDAAKELRKGNEALAEARKKEASAVSDQAYYNMKAEEVKAKAELDIVKEQERTKKYAIDLEAKSGAIEKLQELADTGTFDAYRKLTACRESESGFFSLGLKDNNGPKPSEKDIDTIISSFNYTKDSNELNKIVKYAIEKGYGDDLGKIETLVKLRAGEPEYDRLAEDIDRVLCPTYGNIFANIKEMYSKVFGMFTMKKK